jgi:hypothetical protein
LVAIKINLTLPWQNLQKKKLRSRRLWEIVGCSKDTVLQEDGALRFNIDLPTPTLNENQAIAGHLKILAKSIDTSFGEVCPKSIGKVYITKKNSKFWVSRLMAAQK